MALRASQRRTHPHAGYRTHAVCTILGKIFGGLQAAFRRGPSHTIEGRGDAGFGGGIGQQIARQLFACELIKRLVVADALEHIVAIRPCRKRIIAMKTAGIGVSDGIEPMHRLPLSIAIRCDEFVDRPLVCVRRGVFQIVVEFCGRWRQAGQIEVDAAQQSIPVSLRRWRESVGCQVRTHKRVNRMTCRSRRVRAANRLIRPVAFVNRTFLHPLADLLFLLAGERLMGVCRRHQACRIV